MIIHIINILKQLDFDEIKYSGNLLRIQGDKIISEGGYYEEFYLFL